MPAMIGARSAARRFARCWRTARATREEPTPSSICSHSAFATDCPENDRFPDVLVEGLRNDENGPDTVGKTYQVI